MIKSFGNNLQQIFATAVLLAVVFAVVGFAQPARAESTTPDQLSALIAQLKQRIMELQAKLGEMGIGTSDRPFETKPSSSVIEVGATVQTIAALRVRNTAGISPDNIVGAVRAGTSGEVIDGPTTSTYEGKEYTWWKISYSNGTEGWSAQPWLKVTATNPANNEVGDVVCKELYFTPSSIVAGDEATAQWRVNNAKSVQIRSTDGDFGMDFPARSFGEYGLGEDTPTETTTYILTATGNDGQSVSCSATLVVREATDTEGDSSEDTAAAPVCDYAYFTPSNVQEGQKTTAKWSVSNADRVILVGSNGDVNKDFDAEGTYTFVPEANTTYTLTGVGEDGTRATCATTIIVDEYLKETTAPKCDYFTITPDTVTTGGEVTAKWGTSNASRVVLTSTIGDFNKEFLTKGEYSFVPEQSTGYRLAVYDAVGRKDTCSAVVAVTNQRR